MKGLAESSPFHLLTNPHVINWFIFGHVVVIYYLSFLTISREPLPGSWQTDLDQFQKIIVLKCLRADKVTQAMQDYVAENLGQRFIEPQTADLHLVYKDSSPTTPLIFVLSQGTDPAADLYKFAEEMRFAKKLTAISLGQGQVREQLRMLGNLHVFLLSADFYFLQNLPFKAFKNIVGVSNSLFLSASQSKYEETYMYIPVSKKMFY